MDRLSKTEGLRFKNQGCPFYKEKEFAWIGTTHSGGDPFSGEAKYLGVTFDQSLTRNYNF